MSCVHVYAERDRLVAALSKVFPSYLADASDAEPGWSSVVTIDLPTGQASWHVPDRELSWFAHLPRAANTWDGHTTEEKYDRLEWLNAGSLADQRERARMMEPGCMTLRDGDRVRIVIPDGEPVGDHLREVNGRVGVMWVVLPPVIGPDTGGNVQVNLEGTSAAVTVPSKYVEHVRT